MDVSLILLSYNFIIYFATWQVNFNILTLITWRDNEWTVDQLKQIEPFMSVWHLFIAGGPSNGGKLKNVRSIPLVSQSAWTYSDGSGKS